MSDVRRHRSSLPPRYTGSDRCPSSACTRVPVRLTIGATGSARGFEGRGGRTNAVRSGRYPTGPAGSLRNSRPNNNAYNRGAGSPAPLPRRAGPTPDGELGLARIEPESRLDARLPSALGPQQAKTGQRENERASSAVLRRYTAHHGRNAMHWKTSRFSFVTKKSILGINTLNCTPGAGTGGGRLLLIGQASHLSRVDHVDDPLYSQTIEFVREQQIP
jgi:hypothetical protein